MSDLWLWISAAVVVISLLLLGRHPGRSSLQLTQILNVVRRAFAHDAPPRCPECGQDGQVRQWPARDFCPYCNEDRANTDDEKDERESLTPR